MDKTKQVVMEVDSKLWQNAKIAAIKQNIPLRDFVARSIQNEINKLEQPQIEVK